MVLRAKELKELKLINEIDSVLDFEISMKYQLLIIEGLISNWRKN